MRDAPAIEDIVRSARQIYVPSRCRVEEIEPESSTKRCAAIGRWGGGVLVGCVGLGTFFVLWCGWDFYALGGFRCGRYGYVTAVLANSLLGSSSLLL